MEPKTWEECCNDIRAECKATEKMEATTTTTGINMNRLYDVTIEYLGLKKKDVFPQSTICLGKDGAFLVMDADGKSIRFAARDCKVEQIHAHVIIIRGFTDKPRHMTAYCMYSNSVTEKNESKGDSHGN